MHLSSRCAEAHLDGGAVFLPGAGSVAPGLLAWPGATSAAAPWLVHDAALRRCIEGHATGQAWRVLIAAQQRFATVLAVSARTAATGE